jgi:hypothetical protein
MTPAPLDLHAAVAAVGRALRRDALQAVVLLALSALPAALLLAWLAGWVRPWSRPGPGPLLLDATLLAAVVVMVVVGVRRWVRVIDESAVAADAERRAGVPAGTVRGVLELSRTLPAGASPSLARRAEAAARGCLSDREGILRDGELGAGLRRRRRAAVATLATLTLATAVAGFSAPDHSRAAWAPLTQPISSMAATALPPLRVLPGDVSVPRGGDVLLAIAAPGRDMVTVRWREQGDVVRDRIVTVAGDSAATTLSGIEAVTQYWVDAPDGQSSARYTVTPVDGLLLAELAVDVVYPAHAGRPADHFSGAVPQLRVPAGTQIAIRGRATRPLRTARLDGADRGVALAVRGDAFSGTFTPSASGLYGWTLRDDRGAGAAPAPAPLDIIVVRDEVPRVEITFPSRDTVLDSSLRQGLVAAARDDHGLVAAEVVSRRVAVSGAAGPEAVDRIELSGRDDALIRTVLDARGRGLVPGDRLEVFVRVTDNAPGGQTAVSRTLTLRLPTMRELREQAARQTEAALRDAQALAASAAALGAETRALERRTAGASARQAAQAEPSSRAGNDAAGRMAFRDAEQARRALQQQEALLQRLESMRQAIEALERAAAESGLQDAAAQQRLEELRRQYDELQAPQARDRMEALRAAIDAMDPEAVQQALDALAEQQERMQAQLQENADVLRQAAAEQEAASLAQDARELATQQQALARSMAEGQPTPEQAAAQAELAERARDLEQDLAELREQLETRSEDASAQVGAAEHGAGEAAGDMERAADHASQRDGQTAAEQGEAAAERLERTAEDLDRARETLSEGRRQDAQESMRQATGDALALAQRQQDLLDRMRQADAEPESSSMRPTPPRLEPPQAGQSSQGQSGQQQGGQQQAGQQEGQGQQGQQGRPQSGGQEGAGQGQGAGPGEGRQAQPGAAGQPGADGTGSAGLEGLSAEQAALQQGLQQLSRNLQDAAQRNGSLNREVGSSLARANLSMEQTLESLRRGEAPLQEAQQAVDALNRLALSLLNGAQQMDGTDGGAGSEGTSQQLADLAQQQGSVGGQMQSLAPMELTASAMSTQLNRLADQQMEIARRLGSMNAGGSQEGAGALDALASQAAELAAQMQRGGPSPEVLARQQQLFHRLLDAGRTLEKEDYEDERAGARPGAVPAHSVQPLDDGVLSTGPRYRAPGAAELDGLPPAYRRLILDYFDRLNRPLPPESTAAPSGPGGSR